MTHSRGHAPNGGRATLTDHQGGRHYLIHTDGGCRGNPGPGGWAAIIQLKDGETVLKERDISGEDRDTTNNRMEMTAALKAVSCPKERETPIVVVSDSKILVQGMAEWIQNWQHNGWRTSSKGPVANCDLWKSLAAACEGRIVEWRWVKAHSKNTLNQRADHLVNVAMDRLK